MLGPSGAGKTVMIARNLKALTGWHEYQPGAGGSYLRVTVPPEATIRSLAIELLHLTGYRVVRQRAQAHELWDTLRHRIKELRINLIWIDEAHHILRPGPGRDPAGARRMMKNLLQGPASVALILSGVDLLHNDLAEDPETSCRFLRMSLKPVDPVLGIARMGSFIDRCLSELGMEPADPSLAARIVHAEGGSLGRALEFFKAATRRSLQLGNRDLTLADLSHSYELLCGKRTGLDPFTPMDWTRLKELLDKD